MKQYSQQLFGFMHDFQSTRKPLSQLGFVIAGYALAVALGLAAAGCSMMLKGGPNDPNYTGMYFFGDCLVFLAVFGVAAVPVTGTAFFFLRPYEAFWQKVTPLALTFAVTSLMAFAAIALATTSVLAAVGFLRILLAPLCALNCGAAACFAPNSNSRNTLFLASGLEAMGFACWLIWCLFGAPQI